MTADQLRSHLDDQDAWIAILLAKDFASEEKKRTDSESLSGQSVLLP